MNRILIVAEHDGARVNPAIAKCVTCARAIPDADVTLAVFASDPAAVAASAATIAGVDRVVTVTHAAHAHALAAAIARGLDDGALRARVGAAGRERVASRWSWRHCAELTVEQYREVLAMRAGTGRTR